jgi:hypothetical protein
VNQPFEEYIAQSSISWQRFIPHTPQQKNVAERNNWTCKTWLDAFCRPKIFDLSFGSKLFIVPTIY